MVHSGDAHSLDTVSTATGNTVDICQPQTSDLIIGHCSRAESSDVTDTPSGLHRRSPRSSNTKASGTQFHPTKNQAGDSDDGNDSVAASQDSAPFPAVSGSTKENRNDCEDARQKGRHAGRLEEKA